MKVHLVDSTKKLFDAIAPSLKDMNVSVSVSINEEEAVAGIHEQSPGIVIVNWSKELTDIEGLCKKIKSIKSNTYIYLMVIAPREMEKKLKALIKAGVNDYLFKPISKDDLSMRIMLAQRTIKLEETSLKSKKKLIRFAKEDPHTGLLNRRALLDEGLKEMGRASREKKNISALMVCTTNFKRIVATYGTELADDVLLEISRRLKEKCRPYDIAGRFTVTDFLVILPDTGVRNAEKVARRIMASISDAPFIVRGRKLAVGVSIGIAEMNHREIAENNNIHAHLLNDLLLDSLVKRAEDAMETAGKNNVAAME